MAAAAAVSRAWGLLQQPPQSQGLVLESMQDRRTSRRHTVAATCAARELQHTERFDPGAAA